MGRPLGWFQFIISFFCVFLLLILIILHNFVFFFFFFLLLQQINKSFWLPCFGGRSFPQQSDKRSSQKNGKQKKTGERNFFFFSFPPTERERHTEKEKERKKKPQRDVMGFGCLCSVEGAGGFLVWGTVGQMEELFCAFGCRVVPNRSARDLFDLFLFLFCEMCCSGSGRFGSARPEGGRESVCTCFGWFRRRVFFWHFWHICHFCLFVCFSRTCRSLFCSLVSVFFFLSMRCVMMITKLI